MYQLKTAGWIYTMSTLAVIAIYCMTKEPIALTIAVGMGVATASIFTIDRYVS